MSTLKEHFATIRADLHTRIPAVDQLDRSHVRDLLATADELNDMRDKVLAIHTCADRGPTECDVCFMPWPCDTVKALDWPTS